jgi:formylglycine-generating enzyme required for sulfatase activity
MHLPGQDFARLQAAVVAALTRDELRRLLKVELDTNLEAITSDKGFEAQVFDVLLWLERHERLPAFAAGALAANPANEELAAACAAVYAAARPQKGRSPKRGAFAPEQAASGHLAAILGIEWVAIPGGVLRMGSSAQRDGSAQPAEMPEHDVIMPDYWIARCPITNYQYQVFVYATEHVSPPHWRKGTAPDGKQDHPVVNISWSDALAFCRWASVQLPSEAEWEWAARGTAGRLWPWGDEPPTPVRCNFGLAIARTTPVTRFLGGATTHGVLDMAGNVWEWTRSLWRPYPYVADDGREQEAPAGLRVVRGGSYDCAAHQVRCSNRSAINPAYGYDDVGMRVVLYNPAATESTRE